MFLLKKILVAWLFPPVGLALAALLGIWLWRRGRRRWGLCLVAASQVLLILLSLPPVSLALGRAVEVYPVLAESRLAQAQAVVVLGGGSHFGAAEYGGDTVSAASLARCRYGARLARRGGLPLLVSGGSVSGGRPEARAMAEALAEDFRQPARWVEDRSRDTRENALYAARMLREAGVTRIVLVSHAYHLGRAVPLFEAQGLAVLPAPTLAADRPPGWAGWLPSIEALEDSRIALHEWLGRWLA